ncbi:hypothetical protein ACRN9A_19490 [Shewanella frigidimarina]|uniref:hypothetical protein n=1 Tax=Shewanella frigidimarina TaxID=56812 RepID=UPI003D7B6A1E
MKMSEASKLRAKWDNKPCNHPDLSKEYHLGAATGDYVCTTCGECGFGRDWVKREKDEAKS